MDPDDMQIDSAVAEAMGFSGFGMQNKKRKHSDEDSFTHADTQAQTISIKTQGARAENTQSHNAKGKQAAAARARESHSANAHVAVDDDGKPTLEALRHGVRDAQGDMVYFLPSFIEDPWERLKTR